METEPKISLCMICGNEEAVIIRCLESSKGAFGELCLVQAIGEQTPDKTLDAAVVWCGANDKAVRTAKYENKVRGLEHVDDFGAARNLSFSLAAGDADFGAPHWILWLDCDDYLDDVNCRRIREAVRTVPDNWDAIMCSYILDDHGAEIPRERLMRAGKGRWKNAIHETCMVESGPMGTGECFQIKVFHSDHRAKHRSSAARNLAILNRVLEDAPRHYFYAHAEAKLLKLQGSAVYSGRAALALLPDSLADERYQVLINFSELEPHDSMRYLLQAARLQPHRREAFAYLCQKSLVEGNLSDAVSYFRMMDALPLPNPLPRMHQGMWYPKGEASESGTMVPVPSHHWGRNYLRVRILRASGQLREAVEDHARYMLDPDYAANVAEHEARRRALGEAKEVESPNQEAAA